MTWHEKQPAPLRIGVAAAAALAAIEVVDAVTGHELALSVLYLAPVSLVALYAPRALAWGTCVISAGAWYAAELASGYEYSHALLPVWNALMLLAIFLLVTFLLRRLTAELRARSRLVAELQESLANVRTLSGLLPICAWCKNIRDDAGYWQRVESYLQQRAGATFTHGICPTCSAKLRAEHGLDDDEDAPLGEPSASGSSGRS